MEIQRTATQQPNREEDLLEQLSRARETIQEVHAQHVELNRKFNLLKSGVTWVGVALGYVGLYMLFPESSKTPGPLEGMGEAFIHSGMSSSAIQPSNLF